MFIKITTNKKKGEYTFINVNLIESVERNSKADDWIIKIYGDTYYYLEDRQEIEKVNNFIRENLL